MLVNMARAHSKVQQGQETAEVLVRIGHELFSELGFNGVSAEKLVETAGLTRGALYHHFDGKLGLFEAVFIACEQEIATRIEAAAATKDTPAEQLIAASLAFLDACADPVLRRIVVDEAPSVLGWSKWREIDTAHGLALLRGAIQQLHDDGKLQGYSVDALAYLLSGAMNELAMWMTESGDAEERLGEAKRNLEALLRSIMESD